MATSYEQFRIVWATNQPLALDRVAEWLASMGHSQTELYDALERLLLEVRSEGADDETEERIMWVMDRLTGWCHLDYHIRTHESVAATDTHSKPAVGTAS